MSSVETVQVLAKLVDGKKFLLNFADKSEGEAFRQALYKLKKSWDREMVLLDESWRVQQLNFIWLRDVEGKKLLKAKLWLSIPAPKTYNFVILEETDSEPNA